MANSCRLGSERRESAPSPKSQRQPPIPRLPVPPSQREETAVYELSSAMPGRQCQEEVNLRPATNATADRPTMCHHRHTPHVPEILRPSDVGGQRHRHTRSASNPLSLEMFRSGPRTPTTSDNRRSMLLSSSGSSVSTASTSATRSSVAIASTSSSEDGSEAGTLSSPGSRATPPPHNRPDVGLQNFRHDFADDVVGRRRSSWHSGMLFSSSTDTVSRPYSNQHLSRQQQQVRDRVLLLDDNMPINVAFDVVRRKADIATNALSFLHTSSILLYVVNRLRDMELRTSTVATMCGARLVSPRTIEVWKTGGKVLKLRINLQPNGTFEEGRQRGLQARPVQVDRVTVAYSMKTDTSRCRQGARFLKKDENQLTAHSPTMVSHSWIKRLLPKPVGMPSIAIESYILCDKGEHPAYTGPFPILLMFREASTPILDPLDASNLPRLLLLTQYLPPEPAFLHQDAGIEGLPLAQQRAAGAGGRRPSLPEFSLRPPFSTVIGANEIGEDHTEGGFGSEAAFRRFSPSRPRLPCFRTGTGRGSLDITSRSQQLSLQDLLPDEVSAAGRNDGDDADSGFEDPADSTEELAQAVRHLRLENSLLKGQLGSLLGVRPSEDPPAYDY